MRLEEYIKSHKLDMDRYEIVDHIRYKRSVIVIQRAKDGSHWCVQYAGNGHYFNTIDGVLGFLEGRFHLLWRYTEDPA